MPCCFRPAQSAPRKPCLESAWISTGSLALLIVAEEPLAQAFTDAQIILRSLENLIVLRSYTSYSLKPKPMSRTSTVERLWE